MFLVCFPKKCIICGPCMLDWIFRWRGSVHRSPLWHQARGPVPRPGASVCLHAPGLFGHWRGTGLRACAHSGLLWTPTRPHMNPANLGPNVYAKFSVRIIKKTRSGVVGFVHAVDAIEPDSTRQGWNSDRLFSQERQDLQGGSKKAPPLSEAISRWYVKQFCSTFLHIYYDYLKVMS